VGLEKIVVFVTFATFVCFAVENRMLLWTGAAELTTLGGQRQAHLALTPSTPLHLLPSGVDLGRSVAADAYKMLDASVTVDRVCAPYSVLSTHPYVLHSPSLSPPSWQGEKSPETIFLLVQRPTDIRGLHIERKTLLEIAINTCTRRRKPNTRR
jgi:hypothetical protein